MRTGKMGHSKKTEDIPENQDIQKKLDIRKIQGYRGVPEKNMINQKFGILMLSGKQHSKISKVPRKSGSWTKSEYLGRPGHSKSLRVSGNSRKFGSQDDTEK